MTVLPIVLPQGFTSTVSLQTPVKPGEIIAKRTQHTPSEKKIPIARYLSVTPREAGKYLRKNPGDMIGRGDTLARKKALFGLNQTEIKSQVEGLFTRYERDTGMIVLSNNSSFEDTQETITAPIDGVVTDISEQKILIKTDKSVLLGTGGTGESAQGEIYPTDPSIEDVFYQIDAKTIGKIVLLPKITKEIVMKGQGIGVLGMVGIEIQEQDLSYAKLKCPAFPLVKVEKSVYDILNAQKGRMLFINGKEKVLILIK